MEGRLILQILIVTCFWWNSMSRPSSHNQLPSLLRTVVDDQTDVAYEVKPYSSISGPNGYCVDVKDSDYHDGNPIILWPCKSGQANQIWTFKSDGTLRSNGKCLTTYAFRPGSYIMIYNCDTAAKDANIWELQSDGVIMNPKSGLVLTALPATVGTTLTLETSISSSFQTWRVDNSTRPRLASIIGFNSLCLQATENAVWVAECDSSNERQQWLLYPDGTIRPKQNSNGCLSYNNLVDGKVVVLTCWLGPSSQRWLFSDSGTILNERVNLVMDVKRSDPSLKEIIVWKATGNPNQNWEISPLAY
uniref:Ricin homolog n=1 Tax=Euphorbia tirucalli TaxID=142860 RepID=A0A1D0A0I8_EUPTI|nr:ricin homolog [Euphorbia tirucalli]